MIAAKVNPDKVSQWKQTIEEYDTRKRKGEEKKKLPFHLKLFVVMMVLVTLLFFVITSQAFIRSLSTGHFLSPKSWFEMPSKAEENVVEQYIG